MSVQVEECLVALRHAAETAGGRAREALSLLEAIECGELLEVRGSTGGDSRQRTASLLAVLGRELAALAADLEAAALEGPPVRPSGR